MRTQKIDFPDQQTPSVFPDERSHLAEAIAELGLESGYPVLVLIGGEIDERQADVTGRAIQAIAKVAEDRKAVVISGCTDMGIMAEIAQTRARNSYTFPLVGITPEELVTWPSGPHSGKFFGLGEKRLQLEPHYSHLILVPGSQFGDEAPWIVETATLLSKEHQSVTLLISGEAVSRKDIELSLGIGRPVIALSRTGRLADDLAREPERDKLITIIPANAEQRIVEAIQAALSINEKSGVRVDFQALDRNAADRAADRQMAAEV